MRTIDLGTSRFSLEDVLESARSNTVLIKSADGHSYVISAADDLSTEVELLRQNHEFVALLDELKRDTSSVSLEDVRRRFGIEG